LRSGAPSDGGTSDGGTGHRPPAPPWLPQPESFGKLAADRQDGVEGSTLELYRSALSLRKAHGLGSGTFCWADIHDPELGVLAFQNRDILVLANLGTEPTPVPDGYRVILSSAAGAAGAGADAAVIAPDCAAYLVAG
jgi:alpha-glucosidase